MLAYVWRRTRDAETGAAGISGVWPIASCPRLKTILELFGIEVKSEQFDGFCRAKVGLMKVALVTITVCLSTNLAQASSKSMPDAVGTPRNWSPSTGTTGIGFGATRKSRRITEPTNENQE